jgi:hypothetical protein
MDFGKGKSREAIIQLSKGDLSRDEVVILCGEEVTKDNILRHLRRFLDEVGPEEQIIFWYKDRTRE